MTEKHGNLSIDSDNLFPIIKKWLYSDHDIFYRELISNGCDAITKLKKLDMMGEYSLPADYKGKILSLIKRALHLYTGHVMVAQSTTWRMATWTTSEQRLLST